MLNHLDFKFYNGDRMGLVAPNGSGKTTLFHLIMGLNKPTSGDMELFGKTVTTAKDFEEVRYRNSRWNRRFGIGQQWRNRGITDTAIDTGYSGKRCSCGISWRADDTRASSRSDALCQKSRPHIRPFYRLFYRSVFLMRNGAGRLRLFRSGRAAATSHYCIIYIFFQHNRIAGNECKYI